MNGRLDASAAWVSPARGSSALARRLRRHAGAALSAAGSPVRVNTERTTASLCSAASRRLRHPLEPRAAFDRTSVVVACPSPGVQSGGLSRS